MVIYCPECGAKMKYVRGQRTYVCEFCGFQGTADEILRIREQRERKKIDVKSEYLSWWLKAKKSKK
mgnify:CR=1 FL=1